MKSFIIFVLSIQLLTINSVKMPNEFPKIKEMMHEKAVGAQKIASGKSTEFYTVVKNKTDTIQQGKIKKNLYFLFYTREKRKIL